MRASTDEELEKVSGGAGGGCSHTVGPGDTIFSIASMYGVTAADLYVANPWLNPECLIEGTSISIPLP